MPVEFVDNQRLAARVAALRGANSVFVYFGGITGFILLFNGTGRLAAVIGHAIIVVYALKRRRKLEPGP